MALLSSNELQSLTEFWMRWAEEVPLQSRQRSRKRLLLVFLLIRHGALRLGEALEINDKKDLDFSTCTIRIQGVRGREVQIPSQAMHDIRVLVESPTMESLRGQITRLDQGYVRKHFYAPAESLNFDKTNLCPKAIRQARAMELLHSNIPLKIVQNFLGQRSPLQLAHIVENTRNQENASPLRYLTQSERISGLQNIFVGNVTKVISDQASSLISIRIAQSLEVQALITIESTQRLGIHIDQRVGVRISPFHTEIYEAKEDTAQANYFQGRVASIHKGQVTSSFFLALSSGLSFQAFADTEELIEAGIREGTKISVGFSPLSVVLFLPEEQEIERQHA